MAMSSPVRLIATDLDGTLLRADGTISLYSRQILRRVAELAPVVLVTARPPRLAKLLARVVGVEGPVICCNGALVYDTVTDAVVMHSPISAPDARRLVEALRAVLPGICFAFELETKYACEPHYRALALTAGTFADEEEALIGDALDLCATSVTKLIARHSDHEASALLEALDTAIGQTFTTTYSGTTFIEISATGVDKATALAAICAQRGIDREAVIAFGDMRNDLPMLRWAGHAVAVANAHPEVLAAVSEVTDSNANDGVARALERLVLR
jgi:Cof subfamily protein (haloacid dehalogenase superfamily)